MADFAEGQLLEAGLPLLSVEERRRYTAARHPRFRALFLAGRLLIRSVFGAYYDRRPQDWDIVIGADGKPAILAAPAGVAWNLSHTDGIVVLLVASAVAVGVDIERPSRRLDPLVTGRPVFSAQELAGLRAVADAEERLRRFYRIWTVKESLVKAVGAGITDDLRHVTFDVSSTPPKLVSTTPALAAPGNTLFFAETLAEGYFLAATIFPDGPVFDILKFDAREIVQAAIGI